MSPLLKHFKKSILSKFSLLISFCLIACSAMGQYCNTGLGGGGCSATDQITDVEIVGTTLINLNNTCNGTLTNTYTSFPATGNTTANLVQGATYTLSVTSSANSIISVWIDYNHNFNFNAGEWKQVCTTSTPGIANTVTFTVPATAQLGQTGMRIRSRLNGNANGQGASCTNFASGETEDYSVTIVGSSPCSGSPNAGTASSINNTCPNVNFSVSLSGSTVASGLTYQWQTSANSTVWTNLTGGTGISLTTSQTAATYYRCIVTCSGLSDTSASKLVGMSSIQSCYCTSAANSTIDDDIGNVTFGALNNGVGTPALNNNSSTNTYTDFTNLLPTSYLQGLSYPISVTQINSSSFFYTCFLTAYIDYNHDGVFDVNSELIFSGQTNSSAGGNVLSGTVNIPVSSLPGITLMRLVLQENGSISQSPCGNYGYGETEDYLVNIQQASPCTAPPSAGTAISSANSVCPSTNFSLNLTGSSVASGLTYQWQSSQNGTSWNNISGANTQSYSTSQSSTTYYQCIVTCNGSSSTSSSVLVTSNSFFTCYCTSGATSTVDDDIGNFTFGSINNGIGTPATQNPAAANTYTNYSSLPVQTFLQGLNYPISITQINSGSFYACQAYVYIDFDHDGVYDPNTEAVFNATTSSGAGGNTVSGNVTIPLSSLAGNTGLRVVLVEGTFSTVSPCGTYTWGETEDYVINIMMATPCTTPPNAGNAVCSASSVCPNINFNLNLTGASVASGLTYQWQESNNGTNWTNIAGATTINYTNAQTTDTYYRCRVTCSGVNSFSTPVFVTVNSFFNCYCTSASNSTIDDDIGNFTFGLLNNGVGTPALSNPTSINTYSDFTNLPPLNYVKSLKYPISITQINSGIFYACNAAVYIDYDHDGSFDPNAEMVFTGNTSSGQGNNVMNDSVVIPLSANNGLTRLRVVLQEGTLTNPQPCGNYSYGETEDYLINILSPTNCSIPFNAGSAVSNISAVCSDDIFVLSINGLPPDTGFTFQWQHSLDSIIWNDILGANLPLLYTSENYPHYYRCNLKCNGGSLTNTNHVFVDKKPLSQCSYCNTAINGNCSTNYYIDSIAIGGTPLNNVNTGCAANAGFAYSKYPPNGSTTADLGRGNYYDLYVKTAGSCNISVWIDYDQSGVFDSNEWIQVSQATDSAVRATVPLVLPVSSKLGVTGMRVRSRKAGNTNLGANACTTYGSGETEDYYVNIIEAISTGKDLLSNRQIKIFPNPSTGQFTIEYLFNSSQHLFVKIMNVEGQIISEQNKFLSKGRFSENYDLRSFSKGIYFVQFIGEQNIVTKKIIVN